MTRSSLAASLLANVILGALTRAGTYTRASRVPPTQSLLLKKLTPPAPPPCGFQAHFLKINELLDYQEFKEEKRPPASIPCLATLLHFTRPLTPCTYTGTIPSGLSGGEYVRNGGNPVTNEDLGRDAHWFAGDGMLCGVAFTRTGKAHNQNSSISLF